jgi:hypothetical protein
MGREACAERLGKTAVNAEQAEDWNGASGREFVEQRER